MTTINKKRIKYHLFYQNHHHQKNFLSYHQLIIFRLSFIAIARNAKRFAILFIRHSFFLFFFYFPFPSPVFGPTGKRFLSFVPQNACDWYWACFFGHTGKCFVLILFTVISVWEVLV